MRTEAGRGRRGFLAAALLSAAAAATHGAWAAEAGAGGRDSLYQFLRPFYLDPATQTGANTLRLPATAMPHVLSELEGLKRAVYRQAAGTAAAGRATDKPVFDHFEQIAPGRLSAADYDSFVRDTVNFLDYVRDRKSTRLNSSHSQ